MWRLVGSDSPTSISRANEGSVQCLVAVLTTICVLERGAKWRDAATSIRSELRMAARQILLTPLLIPLVDSDPPRELEPRNISDTTRLKPYGAQ